MPAPNRKAKFAENGVKRRGISRAAAAALMLALVCAGPALGQDQKIIGNWLVQIEADRFGDGGTAIALTTDGVRGFGLRCIRREWSLVLFEGAKNGAASGDPFVIRFRADRNLIVDSVAVAISPGLIQIVTTPEMVRQVRAAREVALRLTTPKGVSADFVFRPRQSAQVVNLLARECKLD